MTSNKPILVTGAPRSGTTWVGRIIGHAPFIRYVHEPFNISNRPCYCGIKFDYWFHYLSPENTQYFHSHLKHTIFPAFSRAGLVNSITQASQSKRIRPLVAYLQSYLFYRVVVKDPIAVFSAKTLADLFDMNILIVIRHPAAVVSSYKRLNWGQSFSHFLKQSELMEDHLAPFRAEIEDFARNNHDIVDQAALLWKLIHSMIIRYRETQPDWVVVRYEDLASDPIDVYRKMFSQLNLPFSGSMPRMIQAYDLDTRPTDTTRPYAIKQHRDQVVSEWKQHLTAAEIKRIRARVEDVSSVFFIDREWES